MLAPGFIDLQVNGGGGVMLNDQPDLDGIRSHLRRPCPARHHRAPADADHRHPRDHPRGDRRRHRRHRTVPGFLGLHLEGPHLDPRRKGAHDPALIRPMQPDDLALLCDAARRLPVLIVTVAPESVTAEQIAALAAAGAVVSLGHTDTGAEAARAAFRRRARGWSPTSSTP